jgi:hypothetical protein
MAVSPSSGLGRRDDKSPVKKSVYSNEDEGGEAEWARRNSRETRLSDARHGRHAPITCYQGLVSSGGLSVPCFDPSLAWAC